MWGSARGVSSMGHGGSPSWLRGARYRAEGSSAIDHALASQMHAPWFIRRVTAVETNTCLLATALDQLFFSSIILPFRI
jgi:hypothetical protein